MITLDCASLNGLLECASLSVPEGKVCAVLTETDSERSLILKVFTGLIMPDSGRVFVLGKEISSMSQAEIRALRIRMGVVMNSGGLVSNLKVWENIMLPSAFHKSLEDHNKEGRMMSLLDRVGYGEDVNMLPGPLPAYKKRLVGMVRAMLMEPDIMIYDSVLEGLSAGFRGRVLETVTGFHKEKTGRTSIFLESEESLIGEIHADNVFALGRGKFNERN